MFLVLSSFDPFQGPACWLSTQPEQEPSGCVTHISILNLLCYVLHPIPLYDNYIVFHNDEY
jgi:hypothetical protein